MKNLVVFFGLLFSMFSHADNENYDVKRVGAHAEKDWVYVEVDRLPNGYNCSPSTPKGVVWSITNPVANNIMSIALTAQSLNKQVRIRFDSGDCIGGYPTGVWLALKADG